MKRSSSSIDLQHPHCNCTDCGSNWVLYSSTSGSLILVLLFWLHRPDRRSRQRSVIDNQSERWKAAWIYRRSPLSRSRFTDGSPEVKCAEDGCECCVNVYVCVETFCVRCNVWFLVSAAAALWPPGVNLPAAAEFVCEIKKLSRL